MTSLQGIPTLDPLTVEAALRETPLREATVAAGHAGLDRPIESVGVLDTGELDSLRPNQLVLSNAWPLRGNDLFALADRLAQSRASAFGVKPQGVWPTPPPELVEACEERGLPLLLLPAGRFETLVNPVLEAIAERQAERLRRTGEIHDALTRAALGNEPMPAIAATVARVLGVPVAVFDEDGTLVASSGEDELWAADTLAERAGALARPGPLELEGQRYLAAPISTIERRYGAVVATSAGDESFALGALMQAAVVCGMQLVGHQRIEAVHRRFERELLEELADGSLTAEEAQDRARRLGWPQRSDHVVLLASRRPRSVGGPLDVDGFAPDAASEAAFVRALAGAAQPARAFPRRHGLAVLVHLTGDADAAKAVDDVRRRLVAARVPWSATELVIGVSRPHRAVGDLPLAVREATCALTTSRTLRSGAADVAHFAALGTVRLLATIDDPDALAAMARDALGPLGQLGEPGHADLVETLAALLAHNMHLADAAEELYFHYNTIRHRLGRLRALLGERLARPEERLALSLAIMALRIVAIEQPQLAVAAGWSRR